MSVSILIVDPDLSAGQSLHDRLALSGYACCRVVSAEEATPLILESGERLLGMITTIDLPGDSGWEIARTARRSSPNVVIGYRSTENDDDWSARGVPNGMLLNSALREADIADMFARLCRRDHLVSDQWSDANRFSPNRIALRRETGPVASSSDAPKDERDALHAVFLQAPSFIATLEGPDHRFTFTNNAYLEVIERTGLVGRTVLEAFPEVVSQGFIDLLDRVYETGETFRADDVELRIDRPDGSSKTLYLDFIYQPVRNSAQQVTGVFVQGIDITERHIAQEKVKILQNDFIHVARLNALGSLVSALAHELNQPLAAITNYMAAAALLSEREKHSPALVQCYNGARESALRAGHVIRSLREMASQRDFKRQPMKLEAAVRQTIMLAALGRPDCTIELRELSDAEILADRIQIQQVLLNLIQNAFEVGNDLPCHIVVSATDAGDFVEVAVRDSGPGIKADLLSTIFNSFVTTKPDGMGIGLSICQTIIEAHGGEISAANAPEGGAMFRFTLPKAA